MIEGFDIIGKTATAQIYDNANRGYLAGENNYIFSFAGMFPKKDPQIIIYGAYQQPIWGTSYGLSLAVKEVIKNVSKYKNIYEELEIKKETESLTMPSYKNKKVEEVTKQLTNYNVIVIGDGNKVINQYPTKGKTIIASDHVFLLTNSNKYKMPDMTGWTRKEVQSFLELINIKYEIIGNGKVISQSVEAGNEIDKNVVIKITLE